MKKITRKNFLENFGMAGAATIIVPSAYAAKQDVITEKVAKPLHTKIKVGLIGCGSVSRKYLPHLSASPFAEIVSVCDIKSERARDATKKFNVPNWYPDIDKMLSGAPFDLFVNLTNMQEHGRLNKMAINSGKHVWSEKPMANTYSEGLELVELAAKKGTKIWGAPVVVNSPQFAFMSRQITEGKLGIVSGGHGSYGHKGPDWSAFFYEELGGSMPDLGVYNIATLTGLLGPAKSVIAMLSIVNPVREVGDKGKIKVMAEDNAHIILEHGNGSLSHIQCGFNYLSPHGYEGDELSTLFVVGSEAKMDMIGYDWAPYRVDMSSGKDESIKSFATDRGFYKWEEGASNVCEHLSNGKELLINVEHTLHVLEIIESARLSQTTGKRIPLKSTFKWPVLT